MTFVAGQRVTAASLNGNSAQLISQSGLLTGNQSSIVIPIPSGYSRIEVFWRVRSNVAAAAEQFWLQFNGDTGSNYVWENNQGNNAASAAATSNTSGPLTKIQIGTITGASATANYFASGYFIVDGVNDTTNFKTLVGNGTAYASTSSMWAGVYGGQWNSTAAVTSLSVMGNTGLMIAGSSISAYGFN